MPRRTTATPSDLPKIDLTGRYLEYMRPREIVQKAERRAPRLPGLNLSELIEVHLKGRPHAGNDLASERAEMDGYYAYIIGLDGHVMNRVDLAFEKEEDAIERAKQLVDGHDVELWQLDRKIATFIRTQ
jgi:hypothetical protein